MYFEEFNLGDSFQTKGRTVTETDSVLFSTLTGAYNPLFIDQNYAEGTRFGGRIVSGMLTASIAIGLSYQLPNRPFDDGFVAMAGLQFEAKKPVRIGDTLTCHVIVKNKESKEKNGLVELMIEVDNQDNVNVMEISQKILVKKRAL